VLSGTETCEPGSSEHPCVSLETCNDGDPCTEDMLTGSAQQCSAKCAHSPLTRMPIRCDDNVLVREITKRLLTKPADSATGMVPSAGNSR
jgi:hypothetical protein